MEWLEQGLNRPLVFVTVGTDHHPYDRLMTWTDEWLEGGGSELAHVFVQSGTSTPPRIARSRDYLPHKEMQRVIEQATAVVCHGGPSTIMEMRYRGLVPIVAPRNSALGEHVDDHQIRFARRIAQLGTIKVVETREELFDLLDLAVAEPQHFRADNDDTEIIRSVGRFEELVDGLLRDRPRSSVLRMLGGPRRPRIRKPSAHDATDAA
jgi:UDP-N-acetylglucosamine transferase subunit ALG13